MNTRWTISELTAQTALALTDLNVGQESGRVSDAPSSRTIRYYTTHGLLDRPVAFEGRTALYTERHLLQLVAIKQLQARGRALAEIQNAVIGATEDSLRTISGLPDLEGSLSRTESSSTEDTFWKRAPAKDRVVQRPEIDSSESLQVHPALKLSEGIMLVLENAEILESDLDAIRAAAEPLITLLQKRRIVRPKP